MGDWDWGLEWGIGIGDWDLDWGLGWGGIGHLELGLGMGIRDWDSALGLGIWIGDWEWRLVVTFGCDVCCDFWL